MIFPNLDYNSFSKYVQLSDPLNRYSAPLIASTLAQVQNFSMETIFVNLRFQWYPTIPFSDSLHFTRICLYFFSSDPLIILSVYLILLYISITEVISRFLNTPNPRSRIARIMAGPLC